MKYLCLILIAISLSSCEIQKVFTTPTAREKYELTLSEIDQVLWKVKAKQSFEDQITVPVPYAENIALDSSKHLSAGYRVRGARGEVLSIEVNTPNILIDVFSVEHDSIDHFQPTIQPTEETQQIEVEFASKTELLIRVQSKFHIQESIELKLNKHPALAFPVQGGKNRDIGSVWGDPRDGGKRTHKGIDIFAKKGTPLIAAADGTVRSVRNRGLGGKQVWIYDDEREINLYYAHLDSQYVKRGQDVSIGDTIGTVGNTGNAKYTPPHLHFGIYVPRKGAIDPMAFVRIRNSKFTTPRDKNMVLHTTITAKSNSAQLRLGPSKQSEMLRKTLKNEYLEVIGVSGNWYHVRDVNQIASFIYYKNIKVNLPS